MTHFYCYLSAKDENEIPKITFKLFNGFCLASCPRFPFEFCDNRNRPFQQFTQKAYHFPRFASEVLALAFHSIQSTLLSIRILHLRWHPRWEDRKPWLEFELGFQIFYSPERINILFTRVGMTFFYASWTCQWFASGALSASSFQVLFTVLRMSMKISQSFSSFSCSTLSDRRKTVAQKEDCIFFLHLRVCLLFGKKDVG